jgi:hypothetical protein
MKKKVSVSPWFVILNFFLSSLGFWLWNLWFGTAVSFGASLTFGLFFLAVQGAFVLASIPFLVIYVLVQMSKERRRG